MSHNVSLTETINVNAVDKFNLRINLLNCINEILSIMFNFIIKIFIVIKMLRYNNEFPELK